MSGGDPGRLVALLRVCRTHVDEIVVALDDRVDPERAAAAIALADRVVRVPYAPPPERMLPWLYAQCSGDWILKLDDDEVPSAALLDCLPAMADPAVTHLWFPRRWLFGDAGTYLDAFPWVPDFQLRLSVNDSRLVRFPGVLHVPIEVAGPARYADVPIYHLDLLRPHAERESKVGEYERERPGLRVGGLAFNHAIYLPELSDPLLAEVPAEDRAVIDSVLELSAEPAGPAPDLPRATREEIDALWPRRRLDDDAHLSVRTAPARLEAGERAQVELLLHNRGVAPLASEAVQIGSRWAGAPGLWTPLAAAVPPGAESIVVATVEAPLTPGPHTVELDLVRKGSRWLGASVQISIEVVQRRRVGVLVRDATRDRASDLVHAVVLQAPQLEPVVVGGEVAGYRSVPGPEALVVEGLAAGRRKVGSFVEAARRLRAVRRETELDIDALVLVGLEATTLLERWTDLAAARLAADRGVPILVPPPPAARGALDRLLLRRLTRTPGVEIGDERALPAFLARLDPQGRRRHGG